MSKITIAPEVHAVLEASSITETTITLPPSQFAPKLYKAVNAVTEAAGGKWSKQAKCHVFQSNPRERLGLALETGAIVNEVKAAKKERQAFYTPAEIAREVAKLATVRGFHVLEPSAGDGALVHACFVQGAANVHAIEKEEGCRAKLEETGAEVSIEDFLTLPPYRQFSRILMNPPFSKGQDVKHIAYAIQWLKTGGQLYAIVPASDNPKLERLGATTVASFPAGAFKSAGTMIATRLIRIDA